MPYDIFISYSRCDNKLGRITQLVEHIQTDFAAFAGRPLVSFFDAAEIHGMEDWRHRILQGLRESRLMLACLSPAYLQSEYCEWEFNEYLKHEIGNAYFGDGVAPIYFVQVPGWEDRGFEQHCATWISELRRRQNFDLRPWFNAGEECLRDTTVLERMRQLNTQLKERITRGERAESSLGNVDAHNPHFIGRTIELRRLRETVALGKVGVLTAIHGLGGVGKTALAIEYAHAFAHEYGGGRWQVRCEGKEDLRVAISELSAPLAIEFNEYEKKDTDRQFQRVLKELQCLANTHEPHRCLLLLDNVDKMKFLEPAQTQRLPNADWLHIIVTTRLGEYDLHGTQKDRVFLPVDELTEADALELIAIYQPGDVYSSDAEREAAIEIVNLLGRFTLAIETAAVYLGRFANDVTCAGFLIRLKKEGISGLDTAAEQSGEGVRHGEKRLTSTLKPTLERLDKPELLFLGYAAMLPPDHIPLPWIRELLSVDFPVMGKDAGSGIADPWINVLRSLFSLRLLQQTGVKDNCGSPQVVKMHRVVQACIRGMPTNSSAANEVSMIKFACARASIASQPAYWGFRQNAWEVEALAEVASLWMSNPNGSGVEIAAMISRALLGLQRSRQSLSLLEHAMCQSRQLFGNTHPVTASCMDAQAGLLREMNRLDDAAELSILALNMDQKLLEANHWHIARDRNNLAMIWHAMGRWADAEKMYEDGLSALVNTTTESPETALQIGILTHNLADLMQTSGRFGEAVPMFSSALSMLKKSLGPNHPYVAIALNNTAVAYHNTHQYATAESLYREALALLEISLGPLHLRLVPLLHHLALALLDDHRSSESIPLLKRAIQILSKSDLLEGRDDVRRDTIMIDLIRSMRASGYTRQEISADSLIDANCPALPRLITWARLLNWRVLTAVIIRRLGICTNKIVHGKNG